MTMQASILLPDELFNELKRRAPRLEEQSSLIAEALSYFFATHKDELNAINQYAEELNKEAEDVLTYQVFD